MGSVRCLGSWHPPPLKSGATSVSCACPWAQLNLLQVTGISHELARIRVRANNWGRNFMSSSAVAADAAAPPSDSGQDLVVQYVVLRRDLIDSWPLGSVVTQGCHASVAAIWANKDDPHTRDYCSPTNLDSMHKVTLEVKGETQIVNLSEKLTAGGIVHKLWIEQPENIPTCLATKPYPKSFVSSFFKKLKLCK
ncbi:hypothetical protein NMG60_11028717 [Bertholletia excelsa]